MAQQALPLPDPEFLDPRGAAALTGFTVRQLASYRALGCGPIFRRHGRRNVRYPIARLREWAETGHPTMAEHEAARRAAPEVTS
jgi:hypothetical protein